MIQTPKLLVPSWDEVYALLIELAEKIKREYCPEIVIGISRGGLIPARIIADLMEIPTIGSIGVTFYENIGQRLKKPTITQPLNILVAKKRVLVIDDIVDTGESLTLVASEVKTKAGDLKTATIYRKPLTCFTPDYSAQETDAWVVFPWELRETIKKIGKRLLNSGITFQEVRNYLRLAGLDGELTRSYLEEVFGESKL